MTKSTVTKENRLPQNFFRENPLKDLSTARMTDISVFTQNMEEANQLVEELVQELINEDRKEAIRLERERIEQTEDPAALVEFMRKGYDPVNQRVLCGKVLAHQEQTMPLVLRRFRTCAVEQFIDAATVVLSLCDKQYAVRLREMYGEIRCPSARARACQVFGAHKMEEEIPFLLREYDRFRRDYPEKDYCQHPLLALYILHNRC